jgi:hypothetical protein
MRREIHMPLDIIKATDMEPGRSSIHVVAGPPGIGKSWFCGTVGEVIDPSEVLLIATIAREVRSVKYQQYNYDTVICEDDQWEPHNGLYVSSGYSELLKIVKDLRKDKKYGAVILDSGTEAGHFALEPWKVGDPSEMKSEGNRFQPYTQLDSAMDELVRGCSKLAGHPAAGKVSVARPKFVLITWHIQPPKETIGDAETADQKGEGVEYEGSVLPMVRGRFRRRIMGLVDSFVYADRVAETHPKTQKTMIKHKIQIRSTNERHCKFPGIPPEKVTYIDNSFPEFLRVMDESLERLKKEREK